MKRIFAFALLIVIALTFVACNPSNMAMWRKQRDTGYNGGVVRHIQVFDPMTGQVIFDRTEKCFIDDSSTSGDIMILFTKTNKKVDILGPAIMVAEEVGE